MASPATVEPFRAHRVVFGTRAEGQNDTAYPETLNDIKNLAEFLRDYRQNGENGGVAGAGYRVELLSSGGSPPGGSASSGDSRGTVIRSLVPRPRLLSRLSVPFTNRVRSLMLTRPKP